MCIFLSCFFCYQAPKSLGGHSGQFNLHLSHQDDGSEQRTQFEYDSLSMSTKPVEIGGSGGVICLPYLVLHHTA